MLTGFNVTFFVFATVVSTTYSDGALLILFKCLSRTLKHFSTSGGIMLGLDFFLKVAIAFKKLFAVVKTTPSASKSASIDSLRTELISSAIIIFSCDEVNLFRIAKPLWMLNIYLNEEAN